jgi:hypothetical protein
MRVKGDIRMKELAPSQNEKSQRLSYRAAHAHCKCGHELRCHSSIDTSDSILIFTGPCLDPHCDCEQFVTPLAKDVRQKVR